MKIIFAGGGTAGHVNPAIAAARYIKAREDCLIWMAGGRGNIEERLAQKAGFEIFTFPLSGLRRSVSPKGIAHNLAAAGKTMRALAGCRAIVSRIQPDVVVGTGGYASFPMVRAALGLGVPTALLEVNATPGMVTRRLAPKADCVMTAYAETAGLLIGAREIVLTGAPVREEMFEARDKRFDPIFDNNLPTLTCFWGSVGALYMNQKMVEFISVAAKRRDFNLLYAAGENHIAMMRAELARRGCALEAADNIDLRAYIDDMDRALALSDLVVCRAGGSLAELCAVGRPAIIVPSPWVSDNHQERNARVLEAAGAAVVLTEKQATPQALYTEILKLLHDPRRLAGMGQNAAKKAQPQALEKIYATLKRLAASSQPRR